MAAQIEELVANLESELRRGTLVMLILSLLRKPMYGLGIIRHLNSNGISADANTVYPLLRRLETQGLLESIWDTGESKPRKFYRITDTGLDVLRLTQERWTAFSLTVNTLLKEEAE